MEAGSIKVQKGRVQARKFSLCQHTIASKVTVVKPRASNTCQCVVEALTLTPKRKDARFALFATTVLTYLSILRA